MRFMVNSLFSPEEDLSFCFPKPGLPALRSWFFPFPMIE